MSDLEMWSALVGVVLPALIAKLNNSTWPSETRAAVTVLVCLLVSFVTAYLSGTLDPANYVRAFLIVFTGAVVTYRTFWQPSGYADALERKPAPPPAVVHD